MGVLRSAMLGASRQIRTPFHHHTGKTTPPPSSGRGHYGIYSRDSFYRFKDLYEAGGELALQELTRRKPILKNRFDQALESRLIALSLELPAYRQIRIANEVRKLSFSTSPAGVRSVWQRHDLETMKKRLKALEAGVAQEGLFSSPARLERLMKNSPSKNFLS